MHTFLQGGVFNTEVEALLKVCNEHKLLTRQDVQSFLKDSAWTWPRASTVKQRQLHRVFDERRGDPEKVKCSCSEALGLYGMLRFLFEAKLDARPEVANQLQSFRLMCGCLDTVG